MPAAGAERSRRFLQRGVELVDGGHHRQDHARNREIQVANEQAGESIGEGPAFAGQRIANRSQQAVAAPKHDDHEADHHAWEGQRKRQHCHQHWFARHRMALQERARYAGDHQRRQRDQRREQHGHHQAVQVAAAGQHGPVDPRAVLAGQADFDQPCHRQAEERQEHDERGQREQEEGGGSSGHDGVWRRLDQRTSFRYCSLKAFCT